VEPELLRSIAVFVEVAKARSISGATIALGMSKSSVSRHVSALERRIGLRLFNRTTRRIELTGEGTQYFGTCNRILEEVEVAHERVTALRAKPRGHLRVAAPIQMVQRVTAGLPEFTRQYPELTMELDVTHRRVDVVAEHFDVAVHIGQPRESSLVVRRLAVFPRGLYAAPAYLASHGEPSDPRELVHHHCVYWNRADARSIDPAWTLVSGRQRLEPRIHAKVSVNSLGVVHDLTVKGIGIGLLAESMCTEDIQAGRLRRVLPEWSAEPMPVFAVTATRVLPAKTKVFLDFLAQTLRPYNQKA
jgi:DNA-binding transcriptional LysR family regulator